jgi:hypothetical protein
MFVLLLVQRTVRCAVCTCHWSIRIGRDLEGTGNILFRGTVLSRLEGLGKNKRSFRMVGLAAAFEPVTLACKWEVLVLVSSCYVRLRTACYSEV